jgi:hypothetical protein
MRGRSDGSTTSRAGHPIALGKELIVKKLAVMLSVALVAGAFVIPASPAKAQPFVGAAECRITLPVWPTTGPNTSGPVCNSATPIGAVGVDAGGSQVCAPVASPCNFSATVASYNETCVNPLPPPLGFANGTITSPINADFNWVRVGLTAVLVPGETAGVAAFAPLPPVPSCGAAGTLTAQVVGVALAP